MKVVLADIEAEALAADGARTRAAGAVAAALRTDVSRAEDVQALADFARQTFGARPRLVQQRRCRDGRRPLGAHPTRLGVAVRRQRLGRDPRHPGVSCR